MQSIMGNLMLGLNYIPGIAIGAANPQHMHAPAKQQFIAQVAYMSTINLQM